jgi:2'-5' RNA ligase
MDRRLFVGVFPSAEEVRGWREALRALFPAPPGFRPVPEGYWHITLWFLGDVPEGRLSDLERILGRAAALVAPFRSNLSGCILFPDERRPRVVALGVPDLEGEWAALAGSLRKPLKAGGFALEERPFHPHLTLARLTDPERAAVGKEGEGLTPEERELEEGLRRAQEAQQAYLQQTFRWFVEFVATYFPEDQLAMEDQGRDVHFLQVVTDKGIPQGVLVYRFPKFPDKQAFYREMADGYREDLQVPEVLFVDAETGRFEGDPVAEGEEPYLEVPAEKVTGRIRGLREELMRRARLRKLRGTV